MHLSFRDWPGIVASLSRHDEQSRDKAVDRFDTGSDDRLAARLPSRCQGARAVLRIFVRVIRTTLSRASRRLVQLLPTIGTELGFGTLEITAPIPIAGRNLPVANGGSVGYRYAWGM